MNEIGRSKHEDHKAMDINLKDIWEDISAPPAQKLKPFQKDISLAELEPEGTDGVISQLVNVSEGIWTSSSVRARSRR